MTKTLTKHGNSLALVIDKPILDLLKIDADTPLEITTDGNELIIKPQRDAVTDEEFNRAAAKITKRCEKTFRKLAE